MRRTTLRTSKRSSRISAPRRAARPSLECRRGLSRRRSHLQAAIWMAAWRRHGWRHKRKGGARCIKGPRQITQVSACPGKRHFLKHYDLRRARAFLPLSGYEGDALVFFESFMPSALNFAEMCEEVFATRLRHDETEALVVVEPLHDTYFCLQCKS